jgi:uncharacterized protein (UPF0276 family)
MASGWLNTGIGLRAQHHEEIISRLPAVGWFEAHSENYFAPGSTHREHLMQIRAHYELSLHGVGLSMGSTDPLDPRHLRELKRLVNDVQPMFVSEHLSWGSSGGRYLNDLLPLPYTEEALQHMAARVREVQDTLGRQILIENISSYLRFKCSEVPEWEFLTALAQESGCAVLLDINNLYVNAMNHGFDPHSYLHGIPRTITKEFHLAGHSVARIHEREIRIDTHSTHVCDDVWGLYRAAVKRFGPIPTLIEWDADIPGLETLQAEAAKADWILEPFRAVAA